MNRPAIPGASGRYFPPDPVTFMFDFALPALASNSRHRPGLAAAVALAAVALTPTRVPGLTIFAPMILAILLGIAVANTVGVPGACGPGLGIAIRPLLRLAIVLLGLRITPSDLARIGVDGLVAVTTTLLATFVFTAWAGRRLGLRPQTADLVAAGTSICGASAVVAMNGVVNGDREDVAHAVATVTLFGMLSMFLFPVLGSLLALDPHAYGLWVGASIHEIAQVVAAGFQGGPEAGDFATVSKLTRVALMAPLVISIGLWRGRGGTAGERPPFPWFVIGFLALVVLGGIVPIPVEVAKGAALVATALFTVALGALGLIADLRSLTREGWKPMALGALSRCSSRPSPCYGWRSSPGAPDDPRTVADLRRRRRIGAHDPRRRTFAARAVRDQHDDPFTRTPSRRRALRPGRTAHRAHRTRAGVPR